MTKKPEIKTFVNEEDRLRCSLPMYKTQNPFTGIMKEFHKNSQCLWEWLNYNGQLFSKGNYKNGQQEELHESFYDNGQLFSKGNYKNGQPEGLWEWLNYNGQLKSRENYKNGQPEGHWEHFNSGVNRFLNETIEF